MCGREKPTGSSAASASYSTNVPATGHRVVNTIVGGPAERVGVRTNDVSARSMPCMGAPTPGTYARQAGTKVETTQCVTVRRLHFRSNRDKILNTVVDAYRAGDLSGISRSPPRVARIDGNLICGSHRKLGQTQNDPDLQVGVTAADTAAEQAVEMAGLPRGAAIVPWEGQKLKFVMMTNSASERRRGLLGVFAVRLTRLAFAPRSPISATQPPNRTRLPVKG